VRTQNRDRRPEQFSRDAEVEKTSAGQPQRRKKYYARHTTQRYNRAIRPCSIDVRPDWQAVVRSLFTSFTKSEAPTPASSVVLTAGVIPSLRPGMTRLSPAASAPLVAVPGTRLRDATVANDPFMQQLIADGVADVYVPSHVLAALMTCSRSVWGFDVLVRKRGGRVELDTRPEASYKLTMQPVYETASQVDWNEKLPAFDPTTLAVEAAAASAAFSAYAGDAKASASSLPLEKAMPSGYAPGAIEYRIFTLEDGSRVCVRSAIDARDVQKKRAIGDTGAVVSKIEKNRVSVRALTEVCHAGSNWKQQLETPGALLGDQMRGNSFVLARWATEALLAECDEAFLGFASRRGRAAGHNLLHVRRWDLPQLLADLALSEANLWGVASHFIELVRSPAVPDGDYVIVRDGASAAMAVFSTAVVESDAL
jgi:translation initiation factor 3 subunit D